MERERLDAIESGKVRERKAMCVGKNGKLREEGRCEKRQGASERSKVHREARCKRR
jgi:hypothetical protein